MTAYYNEFDPYAAAWLRNLIAEGLIAPGEVDERSILDVKPDDLRGFTQCHFFAGLGGWSYALRLAGWPDDRRVWTGSCPCQPFSVAGKQRGFDDARHLWPEFRRLITERRPPVVFGEQVASAAAWLAGVRGDLEALEYAVGAMPIEAASVGAPHKRDRFWFVADAEGVRRPREQGGADTGRPLVRASAGAGSGDGLGDSSTRSQFDGGDQSGSSSVAASGQLAHPHGDGSQPRADDPAARHGHPAAADGGAGDLAHPHEPGPQGRQLHAERAGQQPAGPGGVADPNLARSGEERPERGGELSGPGRDPWAGAVWLTGADGKARRVGTRVRRMADGLPRDLAGVRACDTLEERRSQEGAEGHPGDALLRAMRGDGRAFAAPQGPEYREQQPPQSGGALPAVPRRGAHDGRDMGHRADAVGGVRDLRRVLRPGEPLRAGHDLLDGVPLGTRSASGAEALAWREPIPLLAHGVPDRVGKLRALGNAIVPQVAAEFIIAYLDTLDDGFFVGRV